MGGIGRDSKFGGGRKGRGLEHFKALLGYRLERNAHKSLKQAVWDHFELFLGTFCDFSPFSPFFLLILVDFST
jgi:hypothetical protein